MAAAGDDKSTAKTSPASLQPSQGPQISQISQGQEVQTSSGMRVLSSYDFAGPSLGVSSSLVWRVWRGKEEGAVKSEEAEPLLSYYDVFAMLSAVCNRELL